MTILRGFKVLVLAPLVFPLVAGLRGVGGLAGNWALRTVWCLERRPIRRGARSSCDLILWRYNTLDLALGAISAVFLEADRPFFVVLRVCMVSALDRSREQRLRSFRLPIGFCYWSKVVPLRLFGRNKRYR